MANEINKVIRIGDTLTNLIDSRTKEVVTYTKVTNWYDGTAMSDVKVDGDIYRKKGSEYFLKNLGDYGQVLQKDTMAQMRAISSLEILLLKMGYYKHIQLNGYYEKGDTPNSIEYLLSTTTDVDDGGSVIVVGGIKLEHKFNLSDYVFTKYYGLIPNTDITSKLQHILNKFSKVKLQKNIFIIKAYTEEHTPGSNYLIDSGGIYLNSGQEFDLNGGTLKADTGEIYDAYNVIRIVNKDGVRLFNGYIDGNKDSVTLNNGELGFGIACQGTRNTHIHDMNVFNCFGDSMDTQPLSPSHYPTPSRLHCEDLLIERVKFHDNRRQGLSIESGINVTVRDSKFYNIMGTAPQSGLDIEPWGELNTVKNILVDNCEFFNNAGTGFIVDSNAESTISNVTFSNCKSYNNGQQGFNIERKPHNVLIKDCHIYDNGVWAFSTRGVKGLVVTNTIFNQGHCQIGSTISSDIYKTESVYFNDCIFQESSVTLDEDADSLHINNCEFIDGAVQNREANVMVRGSKTYITNSKFVNTTGEVTHNIKTYNTHPIKTLDIRNNVFINPSNKAIDFQSNVNLSNNAFIYNDKDLIGISPLYIAYQRLGGSYNNITNNVISIMDVITDNKDIYMLNIDGQNDIYNLFNYYSHNSVFISNIGTIENKLTIKVVPDSYFDSGGIVSTLRNIFKDSDGVCLVRTVDSVPKGVTVGQICRTTYNNEVFVVTTPPIISNTWSVTTVAEVSYFNKKSTASADNATAPSATYIQSEVQAILTELRDLKTKLRTAEILEI